jgi:DNA-binding transcriptional LysR family regulator
MSLTLVRAFVAVAESRSFTAAAKSLGVPTSSVSRAVSRLEETLRSKLLERTTRKTVLTAAGRLYFEHARQALLSLDAGEARVSELLGEPRGEVKLTVPINLDGGFLARQLVAFSRQHSQVQLSVVPTNRWVDLGEEGFDLALRIQQQSESSSVALRELGAFHAWLVAAPAYLKRHGTPRHPLDLRQHRCVNLQEQTCALRLIGPQGIETVEVSGPLFANDVHFARQLIEQEAGIGPLIFSPGDQPKLGTTLVRVLPHYIVEGPRLFLASTSRKTQPLRVKLLRDFLIDAYAALSPTWRAWPARR